MSWLGPRILLILKTRNVTTGTPGTESTPPSAPETPSTSRSAIMSLLTGPAGTARYCATAASSHPSYSTSSPPELYTCGITWQVAGANQLISAIRSTGATNVIFASPIGWAGQIELWEQFKPTDRAGRRHRQSALQLGRCAERWLSVVGLDALLLRPQTISTSTPPAAHPAPSSSLPPAVRRRRRRGHAIRPGSPAR
jgi:hypothetical protein